MKPKLDSSTGGSGDSEQKRAAHEAATPDTPHDSAARAEGLPPRPVGDLTIPFLYPSSPQGSTAAGSAEANTFIGKYRVLDTIGAGGMGVVYKAYDDGLKRVVALKMIRSGVLAHAGEVQRFLQESQALARVQHPHIVSVFESGQHMDQPYFVMEYLPRGSLSKHLAHYQRDAGTAVALVQKLAEAVQQLHGHNMLHRDLKPSNVLLDDAGEPHLTDFGLVKLLDQGGDLTRSDERLGTPAYMAPELTGLSQKPISPATDIWALGVILYELVTTRRPFESDSANLYHKIAHEDPPAPRTLKPDLDAGLERVMLKCLEKDPARRFATAQELADELDRWQRGEPVRTPPASGLRRLLRSARKYPWRAAALTVLVLAAVVVPVVVAVLDSERPWREIRHDLAQGHPVVLIGDSGAPRWSRWVVGHEGNAFVDKQGPFTVQTDDFAFLELARDMPPAAYRFRAKVRHDAGGPLSRVGVYLAYQIVPTPRGQAHFFYQMSYNDSFIPAVLSKQKPPPPPVNSVSLEAAILGNFGQPSLSMQKLGGTGVGQFKPMPAGGQWREFVIEVYGDRIHPYFDGKTLGALPFSVDEKSLAVDFAERLKADKDLYGFLAAIDPAFHRHGALGIYVMRGAAAFVQVTVEPLPVAKGE